MENRGFALSYKNYTLRLLLLGADGSRHVETMNAGNKAWRPGQEVRVPVCFKPKNLRAGDYGLHIGLFEGETPVLLGVDASRMTNGLYYLTNVTVVE